MFKYKHEILSIPNILSFCRLLMIPFYIISYLRADTARDYYVAAALIILSCITDFADGFIARRFNMITTLGKILDPIADKATQLSLILILAANYRMILALLPIFLVKECFQGIVGILHIKRGKILPGALLIGKISTVVLFISMIALVFFRNLSHSFVLFITVLCNLLLAASFFGYILAYYGKNRKVEDLPVRKDREE